MEGREAEDGAASRLVEREVDVCVSRQEGTPPCHRRYCTIESKLVRWTGQSVGRSRKVHCPLHGDDTPSLHVYRDARGGWFCFGCGRGGTVYDLAAALWGRELRGRGFAALRADLHALLID